MVTPWLPLHVLLHQDVIANLKSRKSVTYTPLGGTTVIIPNAGYAQPYSGYAQPYSVPYRSGYYAPATVYPNYGYNSYPSYNNMYVSPSGINVGGRAWRW